MVEAATPSVQVVLVARTTSGWKRAKRHGTPIAWENQVAVTSSQS